MKKCKRLGLLVIFVIAFVVLGEIPVMAAYTSEDGQWTYIDLNDGTIQLQEYNGDNTVEELAIPGDVDGKTVTSLGAVCKDMADLKKVTLPGTVKKLFATFQHCSSLEDIIIPAGIEEFSDYVFMGCTSLKAVVIPDGVTEIPIWTFAACTNLESVTIPDSVTALGDGAFDKCSNLKNIKLPSRLKKISHGCFRRCGLESITFPDTLEEIGQCAFYGCASLTSVKIPAKVKVLCGSTFLGCTKLTSAIVPPSVEKSGVDNWASDSNDHNNPQIFPSTTVIHGHAGSFIAKQAETYGNPFVDGTYTPTVKTEPTCTIYGVTEMSCAVCGDSYLTYPLPLGHHIVDVAVQPATLDAPGTAAGKKCDRCGQVEEGLQEIVQIGTIKLSKTSYTYNGKAKKPAVKVTDMDGVTIPANNYTVTYAGGRKKVGKYKVTIIFNGDYAGMAARTFTVKPPKTSVKSLHAGKKMLTVKWSKQTAQVTGYQVQLATDKKFTKNVRTVTVTKKKLVTKTIKKLKTKKKYYVRVRTYKTVKIDGKKEKIYSGWSKAKSTVIK